MKKLNNFISQNSLSIVLILLFVGFLTGQFFTGYVTFNQVLAVYHLPAVNHWQYFKTGHFLDGIFVNWQAAILQLGSLILFSVFLVQRGATHSKEPHKGQNKKDAPQRYRTLRNIVRSNSLSIAFGGLFIIAFILHLYSSHKLANQTLRLAHAAPVPLGKYFFSANFWFLTLQTWQAEYMAIALYIVLSIFLRQEGSPESKPTEAPDEETGKPNK